MPHKKISDETRKAIMERIGKDNYSKIAEDYNVSVGLISELKTYNGYTRNEYLRLAYNNVKWFLKFFTEHVDELNVTDEEIEIIEDIEETFRNE